MLIFSPSFQFKAPKNLLLLFWIYQLYLLDELQFLFEIHKKTFINWSY